MRLPIAASWLAGPAYHVMAVVHHALSEVSSTHTYFDRLLEDWEKFHYHPRVYGSREKTKENIEAVFEKLNPFS